MSLLINHKQARLDLSRFVDGSAQPAMDPRICLVRCSGRLGKSELGEWLLQSSRQSTASVMFRLHNGLAPTDMVERLLEALSLTREQCPRTLAALAEVRGRQASTFISDVKVENSSNVHLSATSEQTYRQAMADFSALVHEMRLELPPLVGSSRAVLILDDIEQADEITQDWIKIHFLRLATLLPTIKMVVFSKSWKRDIILDYDTRAQATELALVNVFHIDDLIEFCTERGHAVDAAVRVELERLLHRDPEFVASYLKFKVGY